MELTINPNTSAILPTQQEYEITDDLGRVLKLKKPPYLVQTMKLPELLGAELSMNYVALKTALAALHVMAIDGEAMALPQTRLQLDALIQRVGEEGINVVLVARDILWPEKDFDTFKESVRKKLQPEA